MPSMNPDGYTASKPGCNTFGGFNLFGLGGKSGRENANNVDLNRDFPKQFDERQDVDSRTLESGRQPETIALMRWIKVPSMSFYPNFIQILSKLYPNFILILSKFNPDFIQIYS